MGEVEVQLHELTLALHGDEWSAMSFPCSDKKQKGKGKGKGKCKGKVVPVL
jgi:hypothetical protein